MKTLFTIILSILVAGACFCAGYLACAYVPAVTQTLAAAFIDDSNSPFTKEQLIMGAVATQAYSFGDHDKQSYLDIIQEMNAEAKTPYRKSILDNENDKVKATDSFAVTDDALSHLDDVYEIARTAQIPIAAIIGLALVGCAIFRMVFGRNVIGVSLRWGGRIVIAAFAALGIWAGVSFDTLFADFHSLFFANGTWTFPADSLLITMLPEGFWIGMAVTWCIASCICAAACILLGRLLSK